MGVGRLGWGWLRACLGMFVVGWSADLCCRLAGCLGGLVLRLVAPWGRLVGLLSGGPLRRLRVG